MQVFNLIVFTSLIGVSWCGLILHNIREKLHSKVYGHGLHGDASYQHQQQQQHYGLNQRGDYGSLQGSQHSFGSVLGMDSHFKAGGIKYNQGGNSYEGHAMGNGFGGGAAHHMMKQESHHGNGPNYGHHNGNNMFGNTQGAFIGGGSSSSSSSASSSSASSSSSSAASSSSSDISTDERPWY